MSDAPDKAEANPKNTVQSVAKVFAVLRAFDQTLPELTISDVGGRAGLDRGTSFRLVNTLCQLGYLARVPQSRRFRLTLKCLELGYTALARADLNVLARQRMRELVPAVADAASLGMLDGTDVVYIERIQGTLPQLNLDRRVGSRTSAYAAALGHAMLAWLPLAEQRAIIERSNRVKLSARTLTATTDLLQRLRAVRKQGYAISDGENAYGLRTVAAPVLDIAGQPVAGVSLTVHADRMSMRDFQSEAVPVVRALGEELSRAIHLSSGAIAVTR
jgi:IclR family pca regulon transcriptional regulator